MEEIAVEGLHLCLPQTPDHLLTSFHASSSSSTAPLNQPSPPGSAVYALQSKVRSRNPGRTVFQSGLEGGESPGQHTRPFLATAGLASSSSDEDSAPFGSNLSAGKFGSQADIDSLVWSNLGSLASQHGSSLENLSDTSSSCSYTKPWAPPEDYWKASRPESLPPSDKECRTAEGLHPGAHGPLQKTSRQGASCWEVQQTEGLGEGLRRSSLDLLGLERGLWRADSLESMGSNSSCLSLAERVEINRDIVKQMLNGTQRRPPISLDMEQNDSGSIPLKDSDLDSGISLQDNEHNQRVFVSDLPLSSRHEHAKRLLERARMKARSFPLKADHSLLPLHTHTPEVVSRSAVVPLRQAVLGGKEGMDLLLGNISDSSSGESACRLPRRRHTQSPTRVRFEDETEKEAESRYLERLRQRRRAGERAQGLLVSKPDLSAYVNSRKEAEPPGAANGMLLDAGCIPNRQQRGRPQERRVSLSALPAQCNSCGTNLNIHPPPSPPPVVRVLPDSEGRVPYWVAPSRPRLTLRTERIKETYIGTVAPDDATLLADRETDGGGGRVSTMRVRRRTNRAVLTGLNGQQGIRPLDASQTTPTSPANGATDLPSNPYAPRQIATPTQPQTVSPSMDETMKHASALAPPTSSSSSSPVKVLKWCSRASKLTQHKDHQDCQDHQDCLDHQDHQGSQAAAKPTNQLCSGGVLKENGPSEGRGVDASVKTPPPSPGRTTGTLKTKEPADESQVLPTYDGSGDGRVRGPMRAEQQRGDSPSPDPCSSSPSREGGSRLSLRRIFSAVGLRRSRTGSLDRLSSRSHPPSPGPTSPGLRTPSGLLRKSPSLQSLSTQGEPGLQLGKTPSVRSFQSDQKKNDRSAAYSPVTSRGLQRALSVEDVGCPSGVRPVGRVSQVCPDGTLLLELSRPTRGTYGFLISRGRGRPDSGVYVEEMVDSSTEKLYAGLLGVGDEIVEVNGEKVAGLSLDLVTRLLTHNNSASVRVLRHRKLPPR